MFGAEDEDLNLEKSDGERQHLNKEDDGEDDEWETEEQEEEELEIDEDLFAGITRETMIKSLGELFSSGLLQQHERDCEPQYPDQGMKTLREVFVQPLPGKEERHRPLNILQEEEWIELEAIFRETKI